jgi:peptidoglycan/xylan/chitin deacetylase (PgdA/CDA1 family)
VSVNRAIKRTVPRRVLGRPLALIATQLGRLSGRRAGVAVVYHRVGDPQGEPARELVPALGTKLFEQQVRHLKARYRLVPASELLAAARSRRRGQRFPASITFDDDLPSHQSTAGPILTRTQVPGTFFVCGASLDGPFAFWWERLQTVVDRDLDAGAQSDTIHDVAMRIQSMPPERRDAESERLATLAGADPPDSGLRAPQVRVLAEAGFEIGFHTRRHYWLPGLDDEALARAMDEGRAEIEEAAGQRLTMIAYPHGGGDPRVAAAAQRAGYELGFITGDAAVEADAEPLLLGRIEPSFASVGHFAFEVAFALLRGRWQPA